MDAKRSLVKYFKKDFLKENGVTGILRKEKLYSKKNDVYKIEVSRGTDSRIYVMKCYKGDDSHYRMKNELFFYRLSADRGIQAPYIFYNDEDMLVIEFLGDITLLDYIIQSENSAGKTGLHCQDRLEDELIALTEACRYIYDFNRILREATGESYVLNDMNLRNFLLSERGVYRVDLEDCRVGDVEEDLGKFIAFFLTYDPANTVWKKSVALSIKSFYVNTMKVDVARIDKEISSELERMEKRRFSLCQDYP